MLRAIESIPKWVKDAVAPHRDLWAFLNDATTSDDDDDATNVAKFLAEAFATASQHDSIQGRTGYTHTLYSSNNQYIVYDLYKPKSATPEEKAPKIKYFKPASVERSDRLLIEAKPYKGRLSSSIVKYIVKKS